MGRHRGHQIAQNDAGSWVYVDTGQLVSDNPNRDCGHCGRPNTPEGHDGCIGEIRGAINACCGHGDANTAYIQTRLREQAENELLAKLGRCLGEMARDLGVDKERLEKWAAAEQRERRL